MLYRASAGAQTKAAAAAINCSSGQKRKVNQCCFFSPCSLSTFTGRIGQTEAVSLWLRGCLLNIPSLVFMFRFPSGLQICASRFCFAFVLDWEFQSRRSLCFRCLLIGSCFVLPLAAPDLAWCAKGMRLPEEFPHLLAPFLISLTNWPRVPLPLTSHCSPWQLASAAVDEAYNTAQRQTDGHRNGSGETRRHVGGLCGTAAENRTPVHFIFSFSRCSAGRPLNAAR